MKTSIESAYATALSSTFKIVAPIKRNIIKLALPAGIEPATSP